MLLEAQIAAFVGAALLLGAFVLAHQRFPSDFSGYWIAGWSFYMLRFVFDGFGTVFGQARVLAIGTNVSVATSAILILLAVIQLGDRDRPYVREGVGMWLALVGWTTIAIGLDVGFVLTYAPLYVAFGLIQLTTAYLFYQYLKDHAYSSAPLIIGSLVVWGLHKFDYPLLRPIEGLAAYGYILGALLAFTTGVGVMMFLLEDAERKATKERNIATRRFEEFEAVFNNIPDPVYIHDLEGNFLKVNDTAVEELGYSEAELLSMTPQDIVAQEHQEQIEDRIDRTESSGTITFDSTHVTAAGHHIDVSVNAVKISYQGQPAILAVVRDVTERKALEQRLSVVNRILRHDIRSAVNIIKGNAEMAMHSVGPKANPLETVIEEADRLFEIAETAQEIERLQADKRNSNEWRDISTLVESKVLKERNAHPEVSITSTVPDGVRAAVAPGFGEAIENVLQNAIVHNDSPDPTVEVTVEPGPDWVTIRIADNGPGIPDDEIRPLKAGEETALQHTSGLGLWLVYWILEESGGEISFSANEPTGTVVELTVPRPEDEST